VTTTAGMSRRGGLKAFFERKGSNVTCGRLSVVYLTITYVLSKLTEPMELVQLGHGEGGTQLGGDSEDFSDTVPIRHADGHAAGPRTAGRVAAEGKGSVGFTSELEPEGDEVYWPRDSILAPASLHVRMIRYVTKECFCRIFIAEKGWESCILRGRESLTTVKVVADKRKKYFCCPLWWKLPLIVRGGVWTMLILTMYIVIYLIAVQATFKGEIPDTPSRRGTCLVLPPHKHVPTDPCTTAKTVLVHSKLANTTSHLPALPPRPFAFHRPTHTPTALPTPNPTTGTPGGSANSGASTTPTAAPSPSPSLPPGGTDRPSRGPSQRPTRHSFIPSPSTVNATHTSRPTTMGAHLPPIPSLPRPGMSLEELLFKEALHKVNQSLQELQMKIDLRVTNRNWFPILIDLQPFSFYYPNSSVGRQVGETPFIRKKLKRRSDTNITMPVALDLVPAGNELVCS
jgi:hypothetical protein